ncbi:MAG: hypothetical protein GY769_10840 [bacterium]|nr:hypothetical protein [bacterium]
MTLTGVAVPADARGAGGDEHAWCGTDGRHSNLLEAEARHRLFERRRVGRLTEIGKTGLASAQLRASSVRKDGKVAVIEDDGTLVRARNEFDRQNTAVIFKRKKKNVRALASGAGVNQDFGERVSNAEWGTCNPDAAPGDDAALRVDLPFKAKFYGEKYDTVFINSDGTVTFGAPDCSSLERSLARLLNGPPAIAGLFLDLDPGSTSGERGVFVKRRNKSVQITWRDVPQFGFNDSNTFQITVFKTKATVVHGDIAAQEPIVGASPGGAGGLDLVDFSEELPVAPTSAAIVEQYSLSTVVDLFGVPPVFYDHFKDVYDYIVVWYDFNAPVGSSGAFARHFGLKNEIQGIGLDVFDLSDFAGSDGRLESLMEMGWLGKYPTDLNRTLFDTNSALDIIGHEAGHRWLAFTLFEDDSSTSDELLGRQKAHWNFFFDSDGSLLQGNDIMDMGGGNFQTVDATTGYSKLDQYLMGFVPGDEVGPLFFVRNPTEGSPEDSPRLNVQFGGQRVDLTLQDIVAVHGPRVPSVESSKTSFTMAHVLLGQTGEPVRQASIDRLNSVIGEWVRYFKNATDGHGSMKTSLKRKK